MLPVRSILKEYDLSKCIASIGGLLTLPLLQANSLRLEEMARLSLENCSGRKSPTLKAASRWFIAIGARVRHLEDPIEDAFVTRVRFDGIDYRVLEGVYEANGYHLQHILNVVERAPNRPEVATIKRGCKAALTLSDLLCDRAGLTAFVVGSHYPLKRLPIDKMPTMKELAKLTTFTYRDLATVDCNVDHLGRFILSAPLSGTVRRPGDRCVLDKQPLLDTGNEIIVALPSALAAALREAVIEAFIGIEKEAWFQMVLLQSHLYEISRNPLIRKAAMPELTKQYNSPTVSSSVVEIECGYWVHFILLEDDLEGFHDGGICGFDARGDTVGRVIQDEVNRTCESCRTETGFKAGLTLIALCGYGRGTGLNVQGARDWFVVGGSGYDIEVMGCLPDFDFAQLMQLSSMEQHLGSVGFKILSPNGLLAMLGYAYANHGHLVPHESIPLEFDSGTISIPSNSARELRVTYHRREDIRSVTSPEGQRTTVRRMGNRDFARAADSKIYYAVDDFENGRLRGVWLHGARNWWICLCELGTAEPTIVQRVWEMQCVWFERIADAMSYFNLSLPDHFVWNLDMPQWSALLLPETEAATMEEVAEDVSSYFDPGTCTITTQVGSTFYRGQYRADNVAEVSIVRSCVNEMVRMAGLEEDWLEKIIDRVVTSKNSRQMHAFAPQEFRDYVRDAIGKRVVTVGLFDDAAVRIGLGWVGETERGRLVRGRDACTMTLNGITTKLQKDLCLDVARFERRALVEAAVSNHEAAATDRLRWYRTSNALIGAAEDQRAIKESIAERVGRLNAAFLTNRVLMEVALSESPLGLGLKPSNIDLSRLMAKVSSIFHLAGYSDAIHYGLMKREIRIAPTGDVLIYPEFVDGVVEPTGRSFADRVIDDQGSRYNKLFQQPTRAKKSLEEVVEPEFIEAWERELGVSLLDCRGALEALENKLVEAGIGWEVMPRSELISFLRDYVEDPEAYVNAFESIPRESWMRVPEPFVDQDRQPWRFRRRLAILRRPILRLCSTEDGLVLVAPGLLRESLLTMLHNFHGAEIDLEMVATDEMRKWWNFSSERDAKEFEESVCKELRKLGWNAESRIKFSKVLKKRLQEDLGDIDVLAWETGGRIVILECKDVRQARTPSEVAKQLFKYQGRTDQRGNSDMLAKHNRRVEVARDHVSEFQKYTGISEASIEGAMVFSNIVPMLFDERDEGEYCRHFTVEQLCEI